ncbi:MAG: hypothetical protein L0Y44_12235 [Phycisphaerales bacterium]|nr:hypothetical protein [Phycisphaerales bacterium]
MRAEFDSRDARIRDLQEEQVQKFQDRERRLEQFARTCEELKGIWGPRLQAFAEQFGQKVKVTPKVTPSARDVTMVFMTELANVHLTLSATTDHDISKLVLDYDLQIIPVLMEFEHHARLEQPLDQIDREAIGAWIDDRLIDFVKTYLSLHENEYYLKRHMVQDPVAGVRFPKYAAAATLEWQGKTFYFIGEQTLDEFKRREAIGAA